MTLAQRLTLQNRCPYIMEFLQHVAPNAFRTIQKGDSENGFFLVSFNQFDMMIDYLWHMIRGDQWRYPVLLLTGPRDSGKTLFCLFLRDLLVDKVYFSPQVPQSYYEGSNIFVHRPEVLCFDEVPAKQVYKLKKALTKLNIAIDKVIACTNDTFDPIILNKIDYEYWMLHLPIIPASMRYTDMVEHFADELHAFQEILLEMPESDLYNANSPLPWEVDQLIMKPRKEVRDE